jgi:dienelactone hydrolase
MASKPASNSCQTGILSHYFSIFEIRIRACPGFLKANGNDYIMHMYPNANHGFRNDSTGRYDEEKAELAWQRTLDFFRKHLE